MKTVRGIYENGSIKLSEEPGFPNRINVLVTFLIEDDEEEIIRHLSLTTSDSLKDYLKDEREDLYQEYFKD